MTMPVLVDEIAGLLREVTGEDSDWLAGLGPETRLDGDLLVDSLELVALSETLRRRFGDGVDLAGYVAGLDIDQIIALSLAEVAEFVAAHADLSVLAAVLPSASQGVNASASQGVTPSAPRPALPADIP